MQKKYGVILAVLLSFSGLAQGAAFPPTIQGVAAAAKAGDREAMIDAHNALFSKHETVQQRCQCTDRLDVALERAGSDAKRFFYETRLEIAIRAVQDPELGAEYMPAVDHAILHGAVSTAALARIDMLYSGKGIEPFEGFTCEPDVEAADKMALAVLNNSAYEAIDRSSAAFMLAHHAFVAGDQDAGMRYLYTAAQYGHAGAREQYNKRIFVLQVQKAAGLFKAGQYADAKRQGELLLQSPYMIHAQRVEIDNMLRTCKNFLEIKKIENQKNMLEKLLTALPEGDARRENAADKLEKVSAELARLKIAESQKVVERTIQSQAAQGRPVCVEEGADGRAVLVFSNGIRRELTTGGDVQAWRDFIARATAQADSTNDEIV